MNLINNQNQHVFIFKTRDDDHEARTNHVEGKL